MVSKASSTPNEFIVSDSEEEYFPYSEEDREISLPRIFSKKIKTELEKKDALFPVLKELSLKKKVFEREKESELILRLFGDSKFFLKPILVGERGVGKKSAARKCLQNAKDLKNRKLILFDCQNFLGTQVSHQGKSEGSRILKTYIDYFQKSESTSVVYFKDINLLLDCDEMKDYILTLLKSSLVFMGSVTPEAWKTHENLFISSKCEPIYINECSKKEAFQILSEKFSDHRVPAKVLDMAIDLSHDYLKFRPLPVSAINVVREALNILKLRKQKRELDLSDVAMLISEKTGILQEHLLKNEWSNFLMIRNRLKTKIIGQDDAIDTVFAAVERYKAGFADSKKPWGVFLFVGPTGVGKTQFVKCLAEEMFTQNKGLIHLDMSEYMEEHSVSKLYGTSPGYIGYGDESKFIKGLRRNPHCIVLLDEIEKAHPLVLNAFLQVYNDGRITDGQGQSVDCSKALFIMTSNLGAEKMVEIGLKKDLSSKVILKHVEPYIKAGLTPEFLNRLTAIVPFKSVPKSRLADVVESALQDYAYIMRGVIQISWSPEVISHFTNYPVEPRHGLRPLCDRIKRDLADVLTKHFQGVKEDSALIDVQGGSLVVREKAAPAQTKRKRS